jgi:hypothetical protein
MHKALSRARDQKKESKDFTILAIYFIDIPFRL